ncbi:hypothetical protein QM467_07215 [Rhodoblastus sp. 17X3]|uniref:hypothetical protein n=1 Tax=Rhodoblastus sp. 17X3 TaxID=3047026 RepID=UPI0024B73D84|nr:hypothetical protein [Rhodoblastus sp. 17X3]MDI9847841.1 hypothetical protein [Rhodoblastus sp. 17X3]
MFDHSLVHTARRARTIGKGAPLALAAAVTMGFSGAPVLAHPGKSAARAVDPPAYRAEYPIRPAARCIPANGAQIMGNFAGADDRFDSVTGELCSR